jgi:histidinol-phosphate aminotransferase
MEAIKSIRREVLTLGTYQAGRMPAKSKSGRMIKLASNENRWGTSPKAVLAIAEAVSGGLSIYPDSKMKTVREAAVSFWKRRGITLAPEQFVFGDGSGEIINMLLSAFVTEGSRVVIPANSFILYKLLTIPKGATPVFSLRDEDYSVELESLADSAISADTKAVIFANPDNPTSTFHKPDKIDEFMSRIPENIPVILDEAYIQFAGLENTALPLLEKYPNLVLTYTFSKCYGLAGLRVGYGIMRPEFAEQIEKIRLPFNLGTVQQGGAAAAFGDDEFLDMTFSETAKSRDFLVSSLKELGYKITDPWANFVFLDLGEKYADVLSALETAGISIRTLGEFGYGDRFGRITFGTMEECEYLVKTLKNI